MTTNDSAIDNDGLRITRIRAKNYRSIRELDLELGPLTVLVGPNASGKSNVLDVLRFIRDTVSRGLDFAISQRSGMASLRHQRPGRGRPRDVQLGFCATMQDITLDYNFVLASDSNGGYHVKREYGRYTLESESKQIEFDIEMGRITKPKRVPGPSIALPTEELSFFSYYSHLFRENGNEFENYLSNPLYSTLFSLKQDFSSLGFYHVLPNMIREPRRHVGFYLLDQWGANLASLLFEMQRGKGSDSDIKEALRLAVPGISDVMSKQVGGYVILQFQHSNIVDGKSLWLDAAQESDGTLRVLGLLTAIYQPFKTPLLGIEEPESAVHPGVLAVLADVFQEASRRTQIIITTHSPDLIDRFPIECIRAVEFAGGETKVGEVSETQAEAVKQGLFTAGELQSMEGLRLAEV